MKILPPLVSHNTLSELKVRCSTCAIKHRQRINILFDEMLDEFPQLKESMNFN